MVEALVRLLIRLVFRLDSLVRGSCQLVIQIYVFARTVSGASREKKQLAPPPPPGQILRRCGGRVGRYIEFVAWCREYNQD